MKSYKSKLIQLQKEVNSIIEKLNPEEIGDIMDLDRLRCYKTMYCVDQNDEMQYTVVIIGAEEAANELQEYVADELYYRNWGYVAVYTIWE